MRFVISGSFERHSREELKAIIEAHGGQNLSAISGQVDYLLAGAKMGPAKAAKATKLGVKVIDESAFEAMLAEDEPSNHLPSSSDMGAKELSADIAKSESDALSEQNATQQTLLF